MSEIHDTIERLVKKHGGLRKAARALNMDPGGLSRLRTSPNPDPSETVLRKLGLEREVSYRKRA